MNAMKRRTTEDDDKQRIAETICEIGINFLISTCG